MEYGFLSVLPPIIAIAFAMKTRDVLLSLFAGVTFGVLTLSNFNPFVTLIETFELICNVLGDAEWNVRVILIVILLGALIGLLQKSGGSVAFAEWLATKVKSSRGTQIVCWVMGLVIFFDDYFSCLTRGAVMRPVCDKHRVSREKLSYILDSTAAPICIMAPISSWVAYVVSIIASGFAAAGITDTPIKVFLHTIPYNFYAWLAIIMVILIVFTNLEYGPMAKAEKRAEITGETTDKSGPGASNDDFKDMICSDKGKVIDMVLPILVMFGTSLFFMLYTGGYFEGGISIAEAFYDTDSASSLIYGIFLSVLTGGIFYKIRSTVSITESIEAMVVGMKSMFFVVVFMTLAWTIGSVCEELDTAGYLVSLLGDSISGNLIPAVVFVFACFTAFSTGSSWGTFAIMTPIVISLSVATGSDMALSIAAVLGGGVFGDHCSPLADTTILSSAGAGVVHMDHVRTQLPYAFTAGFSAIFGFLAAGFIRNPIIPMIISFAIFVTLIYLLNKFFGIKKEDIEQLTQTEI